MYAYAVALTRGTFDSGPLETPAGFEVKGGQRNMNPAARDKAVRQIEAGIRWAGTDGFDAGMARARKVLSYVLEFVEQVQTKEDLVRCFDEMQLTILQEKLLLGSLRFLPQILRVGAAQMSKKLEEQVPGSAGGRPGIPHTTRAEIVAFIGRLHMGGTSLTNCKKRAALRFDCGNSTVERIWLDRANIEEVDFRAAWEWLSEGGTLTETSAIRPAPCRETLSRTRRS